MYSIRAQRDKYLALLPYLLVFTLALIARLVPGARTIDDAYITFRYARNILSGAGFVYNPGQQVLGTTTPLYTLSMTVLGALTGGAGAPFPQLALVYNAILDGLTAVLLLLIGRRLGLRWAGWGAAMAWTIAPWSVTFAIGGMETSLYVFLLVGTWAAYLCRRYKLAALAASLSFLTRPDALALLLPLLLDRLLWDQKRRQENISWGEVAAFMLPLLCWFTFAAVYFGALLPHSIAAKANAYHLPWHAALVRFMQHFATPFMGHSTFGNGYIKIGIVLFPALALFAMLRIFKTDRSNWLFLLFPWGYAGAFALANPLVFRWYLTPPLPFYFLLVLAGAETLLEELTARLTNQRIRKSLLVLVIIVLPFLSLLSNWEIRPDHGQQRPAPQMAWVKLELLYTQVAKMLAPEIRQDNGLLAAGDVGALGYYTGAQILDTVGLMSPQAIAYYPLPDDLYSEHAYAIPPELILDNQPDYLVTLEIYIRTGLAQDPRFAGDYRLLQKIDTDIYGSDGMFIFQKRN